MVVLSVHDRFKLTAQVKASTGTTIHFRRCHIACLCVFPLAVVTTGVVLIGTGLCSASPFTRNTLTTAGTIVYLLGVVYFVICNLVDRSSKQEDDCDICEGIREV